MSIFFGAFDQTNKVTSAKFDPKLNICNSVFYDKNAIVVEVENQKLFFFGNIYSENTVEAGLLQLLNNFNKIGTDAFKILDGEFTFIIQDNNKTIIFRDRHGAGPQVFYSEKYFSSFLNSFLEIDDFSVEPNTEALLTFLSIGYIPSPLSSLKGVNKLPAGSVLQYENSSSTIENLYTWEDYKANAQQENKISEGDAIAKYEELHKRSIQARVKDKNKIGLLLSGGYDSGGNIAGLRDVYDGDAFSYSIGFKDNPWTELPLAKVLSERFDTKHTEYEIDGSEINELPDIVEFLGDPFQEGGLMVNYAVMKLIGDDKPDLILGGDGNDQHFGTAGKELALNYSLRKKGLVPFQKILSSLDGLPLFNKDNIFFRSQFHNEKILNIQKSDNFGFKSHHLKKLVNGYIDLKTHAYLKPVPTKFQDFDEFYAVHNFFGDIKQVINEVILFKASKMSALFNNQLSFPYMSTEIYDFLQTLPRDLKCKGSLDDLSKGKGITKYLHKSYLEPKLPNEITNRKKQGGFAPLPIFFKDKKQRDRLKNFILSSDISSKFFVQKELIKFFDNYYQHTSGKEYWFWFKQVQSFRYFNLLVLAVWWEIFINRKDKASIKATLSA